MGARIPQIEIGIGALPGPRAGVLEPQSLKLQRVRTILETPMPVHTRNVTLY